MPLEVQRITLSTASLHFRSSSMLFLQLAKLDCLGSLPCNILLGKPVAVTASVSSFPYCAYPTLPYSLYLASHHPPQVGFRCFALMFPWQTNISNPGVCCHPQPTPVSTTCPVSCWSASLLWEVSALEANLYPTQTMVRDTQGWWGYVVFFSLWGYPGTCAGGGDFKYFQAMCQRIKAVGGHVPFLPP